MSDRPAQLRSQARTTRIHAPAAELDHAELDHERSALDRQWVRETASCPTCHADIGEYCKARRGQRERNHLERVRLAIQGPRYRPRG